MRQLLNVMALAATVMLGGCGGTSDPGTRYVYASDAVFAPNDPKKITVWLMNWQWAKIQEGVVQAEFSIVSYTSSVAPTITNVAQQPGLETTADFNATEPGIYKIKASIGGLEKTFTYVVIALDAGPDRTVAQGSTVTLTGNLSPAIPADLDIHYYNSSKKTFEFRKNWSAYVTPSAAEESIDINANYYLYSDTSLQLVPSTSPIPLDSSNGDVASFTASATGQYKYFYCASPIRHTIGYERYIRVCDSVTITVVDPTTPPVANAGSALTVAVGDAVSLSGSASSDTYGFPLTYSWSITSLPVGSTASLSNATTVSPSFTADVAGDYVFSLTVNNGHLSSTAASVTITASPLVTPNTVPVANAGTNQTVNVGDLVTLDGSASSDADNDPLTYAWMLTTIPAGSTASLTGDTTVSPSFTADAAGNYVATLVVNDGTANSAPDTVTVTVAPPAYVTDLQNQLADHTYVVQHITAAQSMLEVLEFGAVGGDLTFTYIDPYGSASVRRSGGWSVEDTGTYAKAMESVASRALNTSAPTYDSFYHTLTSMPGYASHSGITGTEVEAWHAVDTVSATDFTGMAVKYWGTGMTTPQFQYAFDATGNTGTYTENGTDHPYTWAISSNGKKAVLTFGDGSTHHLYVLCGIACSVVRPMGILTLSNTGAVMGASLKSWEW